MVNRILIIMVIMTSIGLSGCITALQPTRDYTKTFYIDSSPQGADVYLDGQLVGATPATVSAFFRAAMFSSLTPHNIVVKKQGYSSQSSALDDASNGQSRYFFELKKE